VWGQPAVAEAVSRWRETAAAISTRELREDALAAIDRKRPNIEGAALFSTLPRVRSLNLLRLLVAYQILADFLDCASERAALAGEDNGQQLHVAMVEALDPTVPVSDYYQRHPCHDDGGYLVSLVHECRELVGRLPSYTVVAQPLLSAAGYLPVVLALNHDPDPTSRDAALKEWAQHEFPRGELDWFECSAAVSAWLTVLALLAVAADPGTRIRQAEAVYRAYLPWLSLAGTMLDSYADAAEDEATGAHSYIAHYPSETVALARIGQLAARAMHELAALEHGESHVVLGACMIAMYLSRDSARVPEKRADSDDLAAAAGALPRILLPVLRAWRIVRAQHADKADPVPRQTAARRIRQLPPSPPAPSILQTFAFWRDPHGFLRLCEQRYGSRFTVHPVGMEPMVFFSRPEDVRAIVRASPQTLHPGAGASVIAPLVGEGSFMLAEGEAHLAGRRAILPAFSHKRVQAHAEMVNRTAEEEVARWPRGRPFSAHPYLRALTLRVILATVFEDDGSTVETLHQNLLRMLAITGSLALQESQLRAVLPWRGIWRDFLAAREKVDELLGRLIHEEAHAQARHDGLLAMLIGQAGALNPQQIRDDLMSVILAGHETTAAELAWAFQLLAHDQDAAERAAADALSGDGSYITATAQEILRHRPVFLFTIPRVVNEPIGISDWTFTPKAQLIGCIHLMHHDPLHYPQPQRFRPERFLIDNPPPDLWMPWGGGVKRCPGHHLALLEMQIVLKVVLSQLRIAPVTARIERARWRSVIVTPEHGSRIVLSPRTPDARRGASSRARL